MLMFGLKQKDIDLMNECFAQYPSIEQVIRIKSQYNSKPDKEDDQ